MKNWSVLLIVVSLFWQNNFCQNNQNNPPDSKFDTANYQSALTEYIVEFFDYQKFSDALALINMFNNTATQDSIKIFEDKLGVDIDLVCYFDPVVNSFWPNLFGGILLGSPNNDHIIVQLKYTPDSNNPAQNNDNSTTKKYYKVQSNVTGNATYNLKLLKYYLDYNLKNNITLDPNDIKNPVFFSLNSFLYGENKNLLCEISELKNPLTKAINELKQQMEIDDNQEMKDSNSISSNTPEINSSISDSINFLTINYSSIKLTSNNLEYVKDDEELGILYQSWAESSKKRDQLYSGLIELSRESNFCGLINEIDEHKENETKPLYDLIKKNAAEIDIINWMKSYVMDKLNDQLKQSNTN